MTTLYPKSVEEEFHVFICYPENEDDPFVLTYEETQHILGPMDYVSSVCYKVKAEDLMGKMISFGAPRLDGPASEDKISTVPVKEVKHRKKETSTTVSDLTKENFDRTFLDSIWNLLFDEPFSKKKQELSVIYYYEVPDFQDLNKLSLDEAKRKFDFLNEDSTI
jgi:hypothetical protein